MRDKWKLNGQLFRNSLRRQPSKFMLQTFLRCKLFKLKAIVEELIKNNVCKLFFFRELHQINYPIIDRMLVGWIIVRPPIATPTIFTTIEYRMVYNEWNRLTEFVGSKLNSFLVSLALAACCRNDHISIHRHRLRLMVKYRHQNRHFCIM